MRTIADVDAFVREHWTHGHEAPSVSNCAHCGERPVIKDGEVNGSGPYRVMCPKCGMQTRQSTLLPLVIDAWNARAVVA